MRSGGIVYIALHIHNASLELEPSPLQLQCVAQFEDFGRLHTSEGTSRPRKDKPGSIVAWEEELEFEVGPSTKRLKLVLVQPTLGTEEYVAAGSLGLEPLLESDAVRHCITLPVVDEVGKHAGDVKFTLRFVKRSHVPSGGGTESSQQQ